MANDDAGGGDDHGTNQVSTSWTCLEAAMSSVQDDDLFYLDPRGDLTLHVSESDTVHEFVVCSRTVARSSSVFCPMLYGGFAESKSTENKWIVNLPDDLPFPLFVILYIIHGYVDDLPKVLQQDELYEVLVVSEKYDMTKVLRPYASAWFKPLSSPSLAMNHCSGHPGSLDRKTSSAGLPKSSCLKLRSTPKASFWGVLQFH